MSANRGIWGVCLACVVIATGGIVLAYLLGREDGRAQAERTTFATERSVEVIQELLADDSSEPDMLPVATEPHIEVGEIIDIGGETEWFSGNVIITAGSGAPELILKGDGTIWWDDRQISDDEELVFALREIMLGWPE